MSASLAEMLAPNSEPLGYVFKTQFKGMARQDVRVEELEETRNLLVRLIQGRFSDTHRKFLLTFKQGEPDWSLFSLPDAVKLPALKWKLINIRHMTKAKHAAAVKNLERILFE